MRESKADVPRAGWWGSIFFLLAGFDPFQVQIKHGWFCCCCSSLSLLFSTVAEPFRKFPALRELELSLNGLRHLKITAGDFLHLQVR